MTESSMQRVMRIAIKALATADTPDEDVVRLTDGAHIAIDEDHDPRTRGITNIRRRRPLEAGRHVLESMARGQR